MQPRRYTAGYSIVGVRPDGVVPSVPTRSISVKDSRATTVVPVNQGPDGLGVSVPVDSPDRTVG